MSISRRFLACYFALQSLVLGLASPLSLAEKRDNRLHLKCTNAPEVIAGYYLDPKDTIPASSASATCQAEYEYLYCVPGTKTYLFFGVMRPTFQTNLTEYATTLASNIDFINDQIRTGGDRIIDTGLIYFVTTPSTGVQTYIESANRHNVTYGVAGAALLGLTEWMASRANEYGDVTFQINDGPNWVGNGYIGALSPDGTCVFQNAYTTNTTCVAADPHGEVWGYNGGRIC